jgi:hypothetical protein
MGDLGRLVDVHNYYFYDGVKLCLCGTVAANGPIVRPPDDT